MADYIPRKGDFVALTFDPQSVHEQRGRHPALVISNDLFNKHTALHRLPDHKRPQGLSSPRLDPRRFRCHWCRDGRAGEIDRLPLPRCEAHWACPGSGS